MGLSHDRLGEMVGTSRRHLIRLEKNENVPKPEMLARIADALGTTVEELKDDEEEPDPVATLMNALRRVVREELHA